MAEKFSENNENINGLTEEIWKAVEESEDISKEDFVFLEKNPDMIQKIAAGKEYETLLDRYDRGLTSEKSYYNILIDFVKKEISYKKLKIKAEIADFKNKIWEKTTDLSDVGKIKIKDYETVESNKDIFNNLVAENYEKLSKIKEKDLENEILEMVAQILEIVKKKAVKEAKKPELKSVKIKIKDKEGNITEREIKFEESCRGWEQFGFTPEARIIEKQTRYKDNEEVNKNPIPRLGTILGVDKDRNLKYLRDGGIEGTGSEWTLRVKDKDKAVDFIELVSREQETEIKLKASEARKARAREREETNIQDIILKEAAAGTEEVKIREEIETIEAKIKNYSEIYENVIKDTEFWAPSLKKEFFEGLEKYKKEAKELFFL